MLPRMSFTTLPRYTCHRAFVTHIACSSSSVGRRDSVLCNGAKFSEPSFVLMSNRDTMASSTAVLATVVAECVACGHTMRNTVVRHRRRALCRRTRLARTHEVSLHESVVGCCHAAGSDFLKQDTIPDVLPVLRRDSLVHRQLPDSHDDEKVDGVDFPATMAATRECQRGICQSGTVGRAAHQRNALALARDFRVDREGLQVNRHGQRRQDLVVQVLFLHDSATSATRVSHVMSRVCTARCGCMDVHQSTGPSSRTPPCPRVASAACCE